MNVLTKNVIASKFLELFSIYVACSVCVCVCVYGLKGTLMLTVYAYCVC